MLIEEIWKDITNYEGMYQISSYGRVRSLDRIVGSSCGKTQHIKGKILTICYNKRVNIYEIHLRKDGKRKCFKIHRLVADAFVYNDDPVNKTTVNHIDGDRSNNKADNLEWTSYSENLQHAYDTLKRPHNKAIKKNRKCITINKTTNEKKEHKSIAEASRYTKISETQLRRIANNECNNETFDFKIL